MRVALITPFYQLATRGNAVTVRRLEEQLRAAGCTVAVFSLESGPAAAVAAAVRNFSPEIVHVFNSVRCAAVLRLVAKANPIPYVITFTGTDIYCPGEDVAAAESLPALLGGAAALVFFAAEVRDAFTGANPDLAVPTVIISQGVVFPQQVCPEPPVDKGAFTMLLPAGVRAVKNLLFPVNALAPLQRRYPQLQLLLAGAVIEADYAARLSAAVAASGFVRWLGEVPFAGMAALYNGAHVVLNCSFSEGGMANSLLEGMAHGRALLAADVEGNRSLVRNGESGFLYGSEDEFLIKAETLLLDRELRRSMGEAGRAYVSRHCDPAEEAERYLELYRACCR